MIHQLFDHVNLPAQDLSRLSFCGTKPAQVKAWVDSLPATRIKHISVLLYKTLPEVNRLTIKAHHRWQILEHLRPLVYQCIEGLANEFLEHSIDLPDQFAKIAAVAQALQRHLSDGYILVCRELIQHKPSNSARQEIHLAISRALHGMGQLLYRGYQLYVAQPYHFWHKVHALYRVAKHYELTQKPVNDELLTTAPHHAINDSYLRLLLLSCSHTNQLQPLEIRYLYHALENWCRFAQLTHCDDTDNSIYWIDLNTDVGPIYKDRILRQQHSGNKLNSDLLALDTDKLTHYINDHRDEKSQLNNSDISLPKALEVSLIGHLLSCWQESKQRKEVRQQTYTRVDIRIGLGQAHEQLTGGIPFEQFLNNKQSSRKTKNDEEHPITLVATDISQKGYCLKWDREQTMPSALKAGELVITKPTDASEWEVGTIRWVQRLNNECYIGIERSTRYASPYAIKTTLANGEDTPFFKAMILSKPSTNDPSNDPLHRLAPAPNNIGGDVQLVTPSIPFAVNQKASLHYYGSCLNIQLTQLLSASGRISQYQYRPLT